MTKGTTKKIHSKLLRDLRNYTYYIVNDKKEGFEAVFFDYRQAVTFKNKLSKVAEMEIIKMDMK